MLHTNDDNDDLPAHWTEWDDTPPIRHYAPDPEADHPRDYADDDNNDELPLDPEFDGSFDVGGVIALIFFAIFIIVAAVNYWGHHGRT